MEIYGGGLGLEDIHGNTTMRVIEAFEQMFLTRKTYRMKKKFSQTILPLMTFLLWISPGLGDDKPPDCNVEDPAFCSSQCSYLWKRCNGNADCTYDVCSLMYPTLPPRFWQRCWDVVNDCSDEYRFPTKRGILNKNVAYLLLKLHPFLNQTSQFGFLTSGRIRRITGNFGTEFLGKRSNSKPSGSGRATQSPINSKPKPKFYSLPLDKFAKTKVVKRNEMESSKGKRLSGNGKIILGSEFLGKRGYYQGRLRRLIGNEFLGKRNDGFDGSEFLGKKLDSLAGNELLGKRQEEPMTGTELLGKKSSQPDSEALFKRFGNELLGKRLGRESSEEAEFKNSGIWLTDDFPSYDGNVRDSLNCDGRKRGICEDRETKGV